MGIGVGAPKKGVSAPVWRVFLLAFCLVETRLNADYSDKYSTKTTEKDGLTAEQVFEAVTTGKKTDLESLLEWISQVSPGYLERFTFMRRSKSLQHASGVAPRAVVFGEKARLIMTFNGAAHQKGYEKLELIQFRDATEKKPAHFEFRELTFNFYRKGIRSVSISDPNPPKCMRCHFSPLRPIWDGYQTWDGAYGKRNDAIIDYVNEKYINRYQPEDVLKEAAEELAEYKAFQQVAPSHGRYRWLKFSSESPVAPYWPVPHPFDYRFRPNLLFTGLVTGLNAERIASELTFKNACFEHYQEFFLASRLPCSLGEGIDEQAVLSAVEHARLERFPWRKGPWDEKKTHGDPIYDLYPLVAIAGIDRANWSMSQTDRLWQYFEGSFSQLEVLSPLLYKKIALGDAKLPSFSLPSAYGGKVSFVGRTETEGGTNVSTACETLVERVKPKLKAPYTPPESCIHPAPLAEVPVVIQMCASCHDGSEPGVPVIPLDSPMLLRKNPSWIQKSLERVSVHAGKKQMPPTRELTDFEREDLNRYFARLGAK